MNQLLLIGVVCFVLVYLLVRGGPRVRNLKGIVVNPIKERFPTIYFNPQYINWAKNYPYQQVDWDNPLSGGVAKSKTLG